MIIYIGASICLLLFAAALWDSARRARHRSESVYKRQMLGNSLQGTASINEKAVELDLVAYHVDEQRRPLRATLVEYTFSNERKTKTRREPAPVELLLFKSEDPEERARARRHVARKVTVH